MLLLLLLLLLLVLLVLLLGSFVEAEVNPTVTRYILAADSLIKSCAATVIPTTLLSGHEILKLFDVKGDPKLCGHVSEYNIS